MIPALEAHADDAATTTVQVVYLKDGSVLRGKILSATDAIVILKTESGELTIQKETIDRVDFGGGPMSVATSAPVATATPAPTLAPQPTPDFGPSAPTGPAYPVRRR